MRLGSATSRRRWAGIWSACPTSKGSDGPPRPLPSRFRRRNDATRPARRRSDGHGQDLMLQHGLSGTDLLAPGAPWPTVLSLAEPLRGV